MRVGEIQIIKGNRAGIGQCFSDCCYIFNHCSSYIGGVCDGGNGGSVVRAGDGKTEDFGPRDHTITHGISKL